MGELYRVRVSGADTAGRFAVPDTEGQRGHGSLMHVHRHDSEVFLVLSGTLRVVVDGREHEAGEASAAGRSHGFVIVIPTARLPHAAPRPDVRAVRGGCHRRGRRHPGPGRLTAVAADHGIDIDIDIDGPLLLS